MKLVKYLFSIPFSPKKNWKEALILTNSSSNLKEDVLLLFMITSFLSILTLRLFITEWYSVEELIMTILINYIGGILKFLLLFIGVRLFGGILKVNTISSLKLISILFLTFCLINVAHILLNKYFYYSDVFDWGMLLYMPWYYYAIKMAINLFGAYLLVVAFLECKETKFKSHDMKKNYGNVILFFVAINVVNLLYDYIFSNYILNLLYDYY